MYKKQELKDALNEYRPDRPITSKESTFFYKIYKRLVSLAHKEPERIAKIKKIYKYTNINTLKFRNLMSEHILVELTPRQAEVYVDILTIIIIQEGRD